MHAINPPYSRVDAACRLGLWALLATVTVGPAAAQSRTLRGQVVAMESGQPVELATVTVSGVPKAAMTDGVGRFELANITASVVTVAISRIGFTPLELTVRLLEGWRVADLGVVELTELATPLAAIDVVASGRARVLELNGFYDRSRLGFGDFVTRADLEEWNVLVFTDIIRRVSGFRAVRNMNYLKELPVRRSAFGYALEPSRGMDMRRMVIVSLRGTSCGAAIIVDGLQIGTTLDTDIDRFVQPGAIAGIEVYAGAAAAPSQFVKLDAPCGAIVIWTR